jgi:hypothetical protein
MVRRDLTYGLTFGAKGSGRARRSVRQTIQGATATAEIGAFEPIFDRR